MPLDTLPVLDLDPVPGSASAPSTLPVLDLDPPTAQQASSASALPVLDLDPVPAPTAAAAPPISSILPGPETQFTDPLSGMPMSAPVPSLAQTVTMGDRDLEGQRAAAMADPVSLGERFALNASDAYYGGTLAGSGLLAELQRAAQMTPQEWAEWNMAVRYAGGALKPLPSPAEAQAEIARITAARTRYEHIPGSGGPLELGTAIAGQLAGGLVTPESGINRVPGVAQGVGAISRAAPVIGRTVERAIGETGQAVAGRMLESGLSQGVVNTAVDPLAQVGVIQTGMQPGYDPLRTAIAFPAGVAIGAGMHGATEAAGAGVRALLPTPPAPATSPIDAAAVERLQPTGQVYRTERPSDLYPVPEPPPVPEVTRTEIAPEQPVATAAPPPPAGEPYAQTIVPTAPARIEPAPVSEPPIARAEPPPSPAPTEAPQPERLPGEAVEPLRPEPPVAAPVEGSIPPVARSEPSPEASAVPPEPVTGAPVDRPGAATGRPAEPTPVGETGAPGVVPGPGEVPGGLGRGTDLGERPGDTQAARAGEPVEPAAVPTEPPPRPAEAPAAEQAAPVAGLTAEQTAIMRRNIADAEDSREGGVRVVADQLQYMPEAGREPNTPSEREAAHVIDRAVAAEIARGGDPQAFRDEAATRRGTVETEATAPVPARAPEDYRKFNPDISATDYVRRLAEMRDNKPRPINKLWRNPETAPPEQVAAAREALRAWNQEYRQVTQAHGLAQERDNAAYRARQETPAAEVSARLADQATVPGQEARATNPQLEKLRATRDQLQAKPDRTPAENQKLRAFSDQIQKAEAAQERRGGIKQPFSGPPEVGRERDFLDYKFNDGTSVYRSVFAEAGHNPDTATSLPIERQTEILSRHMEKKFGFSKVEVVGARGEPASRVDHKTSRDAMLDMTRAIHDSMASMGLPLEAISDHGNLRLVIEPTGKANYYGAYEHSGVLHVMGGANSLGHEWIHAIDHLLAERFTNNPAAMNKLLTQYGRESGLNVADNVQAAMAKLINTMFYEDAALAARHLALSVDAAKVDKAGNPTKKALEAQDQLERLEAGGSKLRIHSSDYRQQALALPRGTQYYSQVYEMLARAGEAYMADKMRANGVDPRGVVMPDEAYSNMVDRQLRMAYPKEDERTAIFKAYDDLFAAMKNENVLDRGKPAATVSNYGVSDPHYWSVTAPGLSGTGLAQTHQRTVNSYRNWTSRLLNELKLTDPNRPPPLPGQTWADKTKDFGRAYLYSYGSMMKVIIDRAPVEAQKILRPILDSLATAPGSGRYTPENFEEKVRDTAREWTRRYGNILEANGVDIRNMTPTEGEQLRHGLVTGDDFMPDGTPIPPAMRKTVGEVRELLDGVWERASNASLDIGYAKNGFFPRVYDRYAAAADPTGFRRAAHKLYSFMFDSEVKAPGADPQALLEKWTTMSRESRAIETNALLADPDLPTKMQELNQNLRRQREIEENSAPSPAETAELNQLKIDAKQLAIDAHDSLRGHIAELNASSWYGNLTGGGLADFDTGAPTGKFLQARILPPEADQIMAAYMHTDPSVAIPGYLHSVARRTAYADLFGAKGERLKQAEEKLNQIDGMAGDDTTKFMELVADVTGRNQPGGWNRFRQQSHNVIQGAGALVMMERAVWSALSEPMVAGMVTGQAGAGFRNMGYVMGQLIRTASARDRTALAEFLNVIASPQHDSVMLSRMGADVNDQPRLGRFLSNFYRATFLTQVTNSQRAATVGTSNWFLGKLGQHFLETGADRASAHKREDAQRWFRELGLKDEYHKDFAQFMVDQQGKMPTPDELLNHRFGDSYSLMTRRLVDRIIQDPYKVDRAMMSGQPLTGLAFQLMSFNYSFQKNVLNPAAERIHHEFSRGRGEAMAAGSGRVGGALRGLAATPGALTATVAAGGAMFAASLFTTIVRQLLFAPDQWRKHHEDGDLWPYLKDLAFSRSGLNGVADPVLQAFSHLKYDSDLTALIHGAAINTYMQNLQQVFQPLLGTTDSKTNTGIFNQTRALYNLIGVPLTASILTAASTVSGPIGKIVSGLALQGVTSPAAANLAARLGAGPKGAERADARTGKLPELPKLQRLPQLPKPGQPPKPAPGSAGAGHAAAAGPVLGLIDDIAVPAMRYLGPMISSLSPATKIAAGIGAGAYGTYEFLKAGAPFRGQPAPPPKSARQ